MLKSASRLALTLGRVDNNYVSRILIEYPTIPGIIYLACVYILNLNNMPLLCYYTENFPYMLDSTIYNVNLE